MPVYLVLRTPRCRQGRFQLTPVSNSLLTDERIDCARRCAQLLAAGDDALLLHQSYRDECAGVDSLDQLWTNSLSQYGHPAIR